jgi:hypothetical protein
MWQIKENVIVFLNGNRKKESKRELKTETKFFADECLFDIWGLFFLKRHLFLPCQTKREVAP